MNKTIVQHIADTTSLEQIQRIIGFANNHRPSGKTRREFLRAAKARRLELAKVQNHSEPGRIAHPSVQTDKTI